MTNGFFGSIEGPFAADEEIFTKIQEQCRYPIKYINKIGIIYTGSLGSIKFPGISVIINNIQFQIGQTRILELQDVEITSIKFKDDIGDKAYIDYQYVKK